MRRGRLRLFWALPGLNLIPTAVCRHQFRWLFSPPGRVLQPRRGPRSERVTCSLNGGFPLFTGASCTVTDVSGPPYVTGEHRDTAAGVRAHRNRYISD
ncbi:hypothetical protein NDU88_001535 [Pleurodeles waltl]|uniref:Secreted protein n=1 Tax=Pleurodeles waltl TaxID=8319 RepID=A0AAV7U6Q9_PLEWA|nr:hypothetical protein NDU88_001535 [Pleurodeles waltl]